MLMLYTAFCLILTFSYAGLMTLYWLGWRRLPFFEKNEGFEPVTAISVVIPARNEALNIESCLKSIVEGSYPADLLEIIVVDDHSEDETAGLVAAGNWQPAPVRLIRLAEHLAPDESLLSHKKIALETGIAQARGVLIVCTDADCLAPPDWLRLLAQAYETLGAHLIAAPVLFHRENNLLQRFQSLDFTGMMGITGAGIQLGFQRMGNGANLAYPKAVFEAVGGFSGDRRHASGDDLFLMQKIARQNPEKVFFLKNPAAAVRTEAQPTLHRFIRQRLRWGTKNAALPEFWVKFALALVLLFCGALTLNLVLAPLLAANGRPQLLPVLFTQLAFKALADSFFLREMTIFFGRRDLMRWFWPSFFMHILYIAGIGTASLLFKRYEWKGRMQR